MPSIYYISPYSLDLYYGKEINKHIEPLPDDAWVCLRDYDTLFLTENYGRIIHNAICTYPDTDLFTCETNRLGNHKRCYNNEFSTDPNILNHIKTARIVENQRGHQCEEVADRTVAGMFMLFPKRVWNDNHFDDLKIIDYTAPNKMASFDVRWTQKITGPIRKIKGLYLWHTYRLDRDHRDTSHLEF